MTQGISTKSAELGYEEIAVPGPGTLGVKMSARRALIKALNSLAWQLGLDNTQDVVNRLRQGGQSLWNDFHFKLSEQVAEQLGLLDRNVQAVYIDEYDVNPEDLAFGQAARTTVLYLIVWVRRRGGTLKPLVKTLDRALVQCFIDKIGQPHVKHLLEVGVIDDAEARNPDGYGAWLASTCFSLTEIWRREGVNLELF
jgi:hypothetical protein